MKKFCILLSFLYSVQLFAQGTQTPEIISKQAKTGKAYFLRDNNAGGFYGEIRDSAPTILFEYTYTASQNNEISDDELTEMICFNIVPDRSGKFLLTGNDLKAAQGYFYRGCFCSNRGTHRMVSGNIRGVKMSHTQWYINANVMVKEKNGDNEQLVNKKVKGYFNIISPQK
jgi:hypothetical protein